MGSSLHLMRTARASSYVEAAASRPAASVAGGPRSEISAGVVRIRGHEGRELGLGVDLVEDFSCQPAVQAAHDLLALTPTVRCGQLSRQ